MLPLNGECTIGTNYIIEPFSDGKVQTVNSHFRLHALKLRISGKYAKIFGKL